MTFHWKWSYQNRSGYQFHGIPGIGSGEIEVSRELGWLEPYMRQIHNGGPDSFQRNVLDMVGGCLVRLDRYTPGKWNRWDESLYRSFVSQLRDSHAKESAEIARYKAECPDIDYSWCDRPLVIPRPMYWDLEANDRYWVEPWFEACEVAA